MSGRETLKALEVAIEYSEYALAEYSQVRGNETEILNQLISNLKNLRIVKHELELSLYPYLEK